MVQKFHSTWHCLRPFLKTACQCVFPYQTDSKNNSESSTTGARNLMFSIQKVLNAVVGKMYQVPGKMYQVPQIGNQNEKQKHLKQQMLGRRWPKKSTFDFRMNSFNLCIYIYIHIISVFFCVYL